MQGPLHKARERLTAAIEYRIFSEGAAWPTKKEHLMELEERAIVEWRLGNLEVAIDAYNLLWDHCVRILGDDDDDMTVATGISLRKVKEQQTAMQKAE